MLRALQAMSLSARQAQPAAQSARHPAAASAAPSTDAASSAGASPPQPFTPGTSTAGSLEGSPSDTTAGGRVAVSGPGAAERESAAPGQRHVSMMSAQRENASGGAAPSPKALTPPAQRQLSAASAPTSSPLVDVSNLPPLMSPSSQPQSAASPHQFATPGAGHRQGAFPAASPMLTPPTAFRKPRPHFATAEDARTFLEVRTTPSILPLVPGPLLPSAQLSKGQF